MDATNVKTRLLPAALAILLLNAHPGCSFSFTPTGTVTTKLHVLTRPQLSPTAVGPSSLFPLSISKPHRKIQRSLSMTAAAAASTTINDDNDDKDPPLFEPPFRGIRRDYQMRLPHYATDITQGLNAQCLAAILFLFFACLGEFARNSLLTLGPSSFVLESSLIV